MKSNNLLDKKPVNLRELRDVCFRPTRAFDTFVIDGVKPVTWRDKDNPDIFYHFYDRGANILGVAHLDTYGLDYGYPAKHFQRIRSRVYCGSLDDRLGVYTLSHHLIDLKYDILLTTNEERVQSTAEYFNTSKQYNWIFQFDRRGDDIVLYQYDDKEFYELLEMVDFKIDKGSYTDICLLEHLGCKGINFGCGYQDAHSPYAYFNLAVYRRMIAKFRELHSLIEDVYLPHTPTPYWNDQNWVGYNRGECTQCLIDTWILSDGLCDDCAQWYYGHGS